MGPEKKEDEQTEENNLVVAKKEAGKGKRNEVQKLPGGGNTWKGV